MWGVKLGVSYDSESIPSIFFCMKNIPWAKNGSLKTVKNDDSSLNHSFVGPFVAEQMFFMQNKCLQWIQNHKKPLVWHLTCYLKQIYFLYFFPVQ